MRALLLAGTAALLPAAALSAQHTDHSMHRGMPGMRMPPKPAARPAAKARPAEKPRPLSRRTPAPRRAAPVADPHVGHHAHTPSVQVPPATPDPHAGHVMPGNAPDPHAGHVATSEPQSPAAPGGTDLPPGNAPAPAPSADHLADRYWGADAMTHSRERDLRREHGGMTYYQVLFNVAEYQARRGRDGYRWDGEAWVGGDVDRLALKTEGDGEYGRPVAQAEVQALYSRALDPYWNLQVGVRYDVSPNPSRTYASVGVEGLAPYWFDVEGTLFLSDKGDLLARGEAWYDLRVTQYAVLQPRVEFNLAAQDVPENAIGSGLSDAEIGLRLRYEKSRRLSPYVGVSWERTFGDTRRFARALGGDAGGFSLVAGFRAWL